MKKIKNYLGIQFITLRDAWIILHDFQGVGTICLYIQKEELNMQFRKRHILHILINILIHIVNVI